MENISFESTSLVVENLIVKYRKEYKYIFLVGYSVGAKIGWLCSDKSDIINGVIGYYGSRIRDYLYVRTKCPVLLFFSNKEASIDVGKLISSTDKIKINTYLINGDHGFGDPFIKNYCALLDKKTKVLIEKFLKRTINNIQIWTFNNIGRWGYHKDTGYYREIVETLWDGEHFISKKEGMK